MKEWKCVQVGHHKNIGETVEEWEKNGWRLHTYQATGFGTDVKHYLLFEKFVYSARDIRRGFSDVSDRL